MQGHDKQAAVSAGSTMNRQVSVQGSMWASSYQCRGQCEQAAISAGVNVSRQLSIQGRDERAAISAGAWWAGSYQCRGQCQSINQSISTFKTHRLIKNHASARSVTRYWQKRSILWAGSYQCRGQCEQAAIRAGAAIGHHCRQQFNKFFQLERLMYCFTDPLVLDLQLVHDGHLPRRTGQHDLDADAQKRLCKIQQGGRRRRDGECRRGSVRRRTLLEGIWVWIWSYSKTSWRQ